MLDHETIDRLIKDLLELKDHSTLQNAEALYKKECEKTAALQFELNQSKTVITDLQTKLKQLENETLSLLKEKARNDRGHEIEFLKAELAKKSGEQQAFINDALQIGKLQARIIELESINSKLENELAKKMSFSKGGIFETDFENAIIEFNEKYQASNWLINRTSGKSHCGDFILINKATKQQIMIDVKNYSTPVPQKEIEKLKSDMASTGIKYGLMVSTNKISTKILFETEHVLLNGNHSVISYISLFDLQHTGFLFTCLQNLIDSGESPKLEMENINTIDTHLTVVEKNNIRDQSELTKIRRAVNSLMDLHKSEKFEITETVADATGEIDINKLTKQNFSLYKNKLVHVGPPRMKTSSHVVVFEKEGNPCYLFATQKTVKNYKDNIIFPVSVIGEN